MKMLNLPNIFTLGNLFCGCLAIIFALGAEFITASVFVLIASLLDFFDGMIARILKISGEFGKQLDSLADAVSFGVVPGIFMTKLIEWSFAREKGIDITDVHSMDFHFGYLPLIGLLIALFSILRLAKFNLDDRQTSEFIGLPTPANTILIASLPVILLHTDAESFAEIFLNIWFLIILTLCSCVLLVCELPLFSLKFKSLKWKKNEYRISFLVLSCVLIFTLHITAIPLIIILYVIMSAIRKSKEKANKISTSVSTGITDNEKYKRFENIIKKSLDTDIKEIIEFYKTMNEEPGAFSIIKILYRLAKDSGGENYIKINFKFIKEVIKNNINVSENVNWDDTYYHVTGKKLKVKDGGTRGHKQPTYEQVTNDAKKAQNKNQQEENEDDHQKELL